MRSPRNGTWAEGPGHAIADVRRSDVVRCRTPASGLSHSLTRARAAGQPAPMGFRTPGIGDRLRTAIGEGLREQEPLAHHTTFRIGGPADWFLAARTE